MNKLNTDFFIKKINARWRFILVCLSAGFLILQAPVTLAVGTAAGTSIQNQASASYQSGVTTVNVNSNVTSHTVNEVVDVVVTTQTPSVAVATPDSDQPTRFRVTNTGNGTETFTLSTNIALGGDDFDPTLNAVYIDDGDGVYEPGTDDVLYIGGTNDPSLDANTPGIDFIEIWVSVNIPAALADTNIGIIELLADSNNPGAAGSAAGTILAGQGDGGTDAIVGTTNADSSDQANYTVTTISVIINKSATIVDPYGGTAVVPNSTITYTLAVQVNGTGTANNLLINDAVPAQTTYNASTITVDGGARGDLASDGDNADFNITTPGSITVDLGNVVAPDTFSISFQVTVQ